MRMTRSQAHRLEAGPAVMLEASQGTRAAARWAWERALRAACRILWRASVPFDDVPASAARHLLPRECDKRSYVSSIRKRGC